MRIQDIKKAFTLIELLVVITIIGILATGATTVYTSQIQKARDTTRINDLKALQSGIEQVYQDSSQYPHSDSFFNEVSVYVEKFPKDPKHWEPCNNWWVPANQPDCAYSYIVNDDNNWITFGEYEISTSFENSWNVTKKAALDWGWIWVELTRLELWMDISENDSWIGIDAVTPMTWACTLAWGVGWPWSWVNSLIVINWNPTTPTTSDCN